MNTTGHIRRGLISSLVFGVCLSGCSGLTGQWVERVTPAAGDFAFNKFEVVTGAAERQTVLTGFLLESGVAELAVVSIDENDDRLLRIYQFSDGTWLPGLDATLRPEVSFVDVANIDGIDRLITYEPGRLNWFDPGSASERSMVAVTSSFVRPRRDEVAHVDVTRDLNGDGRDDLVVPNRDGFWVFVQMNDGAFANPLRLGPPTDLSGIYGAGGYRYNPWSQSRIHEVDYNQDGRSDLVFWKEDHFQVHLQGLDGLFAQTADSFSTDVTFDSDKVSWLATKERKGKALHSLTDLNGDEVADLVIFSLQGRESSTKHSAYEVHFGTPTADGGSAFTSEASTVFRTEGSIQLGMDRHDLDGDGQGELMFTTIDIDYLTSSAWKRWKGFWGDDVWLDLEFYQMSGGRYLKTPHATRRIQLDGDPSPSEPGWVPLDIVIRGRTHQSLKTQDVWQRAFNPTLLVGDVTGDGRADLLIGDHPRILDVFVGVPGPTLFARRPQQVAVSVPNDEEYAWLVDLNKDGVLDVLMHHPFTLRNAHGAPIGQLGTHPQLVTMLISR